MFTDLSFIVKACIKPQYVDQIPKAVKGTVSAMLDKKDEMKVQDHVCKQFGEFLYHVDKEFVICTNQVVLHYNVCISTWRMTFGEWR